MVLIFGLIGSCISWYNLPASAIITAAIVPIKGRSVWEYEKAKRSNIAKLPDATCDIINCSTAQSAGKRIEKLKKN